MLETFSRIEDRILRNGQYLLISFSGSQHPEESSYTGFRVTKHNLTTLYYNFATEVPNFLPMAPFGGQASATTSPPYISNFKFSLQLAQNVTDMFDLSKNYDAYQVFYGIAPSYLRTMLQIQQQFIAVLEQNINPSPSFVEMGIDGFQSPLFAPDPRTEFIVFSNLTYNMTLMNTATIPIMPAFNFVINRMTLEPLSKQDIRKAILAGFPIRTLGAVDSSIPISREKYPGLQTVTYKEVYGGGM